MKANESVSKLAVGVLKETAPETVFKPESIVKVVSGVNPRRSPLDYSM